MKTEGDIDEILRPSFFMAHPLLLGVFCAVTSAVFPVDIVGETASITALIIYLFVHIEVIVVSVITRFP